MIPVLQRSLPVSDFQSELFYTRIYSHTYTLKKPGSKALTGDMESRLKVFKNQRQSD